MINDAPPADDALEPFQSLATLYALHVSFVRTTVKKFQSLDMLMLGPLHTVASSFLQSEWQLVR